MTARRAVVMDINDQLRAISGAITDCVPWHRIMMSDVIHFVGRTQRDCPQCRIASAAVLVAMLTFCTPIDTCIAARTPLWHPW